MRWFGPTRQEKAARGPRCATCRHFDNAPASLEAAFPNLAAMSSGYGSVRSHDGICGALGLYLPATDGCEQHAAALPVAA